jgi:acetyl esterase/lipase
MVRPLDPVWTRSAHFFARAVQTGREWARNWVVAVSWIFLAVASWGGLWTLVSFAPPRRPQLFMAIGFFAAWWTTELAPLHLAAEIIGVAIFVWLGALAYWPGWLALALAIASAAGLASSIKGAFGTRCVVDRALEEAIAANWRSDLAPQLCDAGRVEWPRVFLPFHVRRAGVQRIANLQYVDDGDRHHRLDIYRRAAVEHAPVLLQIHGGGWMISNKHQQALPLMYRLAAEGWVCVSINYRLSPRATWPDHLVDCKLALAWIRGHIAEFGGNPDYVVVTGGSAGGHLTALMGLTANDPQWQPGFESVDTTVRAMVPFYGVFDWTDRLGIRNHDGLQKILERRIVKQRIQDAPAVYDAASPMSHLHAGAPPTLIIHGDLDTLAPVEEAREFAARLRAVSRSPVAYAELRGAHHAFEIFNSIRTLQTVAGVEEFLDWLLSVDPCEVPRPSGATSPVAPDRSRNGEVRAVASDPIPRARMGR